MKIRLVDIVGAPNDIKVSNDIILGVLSYTFKLSDVPLSVIEYISVYSDIMTVEPSKSILSRLGSKDRNKPLSFAYDNRINKLIVAYIKLVEPLLKFSTVDATQLILPAVNRDCYFTISDDGMRDLLKDSFTYDNNIHIKLAAVGIYNNIPEMFRVIYYYDNDLESTFKEPIYDYTIADNIKPNNSIVSKIKNIVNKILH